MMLSPHFSLREFERTNTGLPNVAGPTARSRLRALCREVLEPLREDLGQPVHVTSGYRSREVNEEVNGSKTSQHMQGEAADIVLMDENVETIDFASFRIEVAVVPVGHGEDDAHDVLTVRAWRIGEEGEEEEAIDRSIGELGCVFFRNT